MSKIFRVTALFIKIILAIVTLAASILLICLMFPEYGNTYYANVFSFISLLTPVIILANILFLAIWSIQWSKIVFIPIVTLIISVGVWSRYIQLPFLKEYENKEGIKVMGYNVHLFMNKEWVNSSDSIVDVIRRENPDVLCLQEYENHNKVEIENTMSAKLPYLKYNYIKIFSPQNAETGKGLAIFSKYPIIKKGYIDFDSCTYGTIYADLLINKKDTIRVFNNHLQTSSIDDIDKKYLTYDSLANSKNISERSIRILKKLHSNNGLRALQADSISMFIEDTKYPHIVCGDFNDVPASYVYSKMIGDKKDAFISKGKGYGYTFNDFHNYLRIDYMFYSDKFKCVLYRSPHIEISDHNPIIGQFVIKK